MADGLSSQTEAALAAQIAQYYDDPLGFVLFAYPWGRPTLPDGSTNPLANKTGPEPWQRRLLKAMGEHIKETGLASFLGLDSPVFRAARASGHGVGKSAMVSWVVHFLMSTRPDTRGAVTANTQTQLDTRTWPELSKWHNLLINKHWFTWTATSYYFAKYPEDRRKNYMVTAATVSENNTEAFQGLHNEGKCVFIIFDEASGLFAKLWEVAQGAFSDGEGFFFAFGNPTQSTGEFAECFGKYAHMWNTEHVDSRHVSFTNKRQLADQIAMWGIDDDRTKVRILGQFPEQSYGTFISKLMARDAQERQLESDPGAALIMAVDCSRGGPDESVIGWRQGRDARTRKQMIFTGIKSTVVLADRVADQINLTRPDAVVIESVGPGAGVIDHLRARGYKIIEIHPGAHSSDPLHYFRKRDEIWGLMRDWLETEGCIGDDPMLFEQLTTIQATLDAAEQRIKIEKKEDYKERTRLSSPDRADTLALTFAVKLARRDANNRHAAGHNGGLTTITDYDVINY